MGRNTKTKTKRANPIIVVAIIGLIGTVITAIFGSPVLIAWMQKTEKVPTSSSQIINIAPLGLVEVSSISSQADFCQNGQSAIDGVISGYPDNPCNEWVASHTDSKAWIKLSFAQPYQISQIILYDRVNDTENILSGVLEFSDGTKQKVDALPNDGAAKVISLVESKTVEWLKFTVDQTVSTGTNTGLAEIQVMGFPKNP